MSNNKLAKDGLNKVWLKGWELLYTLIGNVNTDKGTLQEQIDYVAENSTAMKDITQSDFDAKTDEEKAGKLWNITDATEVPISAILINDQAPSASMAYSSQKVEELVQPKYSNPNLLDNGWFTVNQRGKSSYTVTNKYSIDRWKTWGTLTIDVSDGITINKSSNDVRYFYQCLESNLCNELSGKTVTVSVLLQNGDLHEETLLFDSTKTIGITDGWSVNIANEPALHASGKIIRFWNNSSADSLQLKAVKLELGSVSTLANDTAPNYATELAKCQRYYQRIISSSATANTYYTLGYAISTPCVEWNIQYPVEMRAKPTVTWDATKINYTIFGNNATNSVPFTDAPAAGVPFTGYDGGTKMMYFRCNDNTNKPFTVGQPVRITFTPNTVIELSADL